MCAKCVRVVLVLRGPIGKGGSCGVQWEGQRSIEVGLTSTKNTFKRLMYGMEAGMEIY